MVSRFRFGLFPLPRSDDWRFCVCARGSFNETQEKLSYLEDRWDDRVAKTFGNAELLRYRSNCWGLDLSYHNFGGEIQFRDLRY